MNQSFNDLLTQTIVSLYYSERFYAEVLLQMNRHITKRVPTAGVSITDKINLYINPEYFLTLTHEQRVAVLIHECKHILHGHISRGKTLAPEVYSKDKKDMVDNAINQMKHRSLNVGMDCAINQDIKDIPEDAMFPAKFDLPDKQTFEWYFENLKDNEKAKGLMEFDDHAIWSESEGDKEVLKEKVRQAINDAAKKARAAGCMTGDAELLVSKLNENKINWKTQLKRFVARTTEVVIATSRKKRNRRYGVQFPGMIKEERLHIGVAMDTSGSVSDHALTQFLSEINNISKYAVVTVVQADSEVKNSHVFNPKKEYKIEGRGGTAYKPALDYFTNETEVDAVIYFGDMDTSDEADLTKPKYPVLWAIVGNQEPPVSWGSKIYIEMDKE
jgi:predicted metal-dependent peptidase